MVINNQFNLGQIVYLISDHESHQRIVTGIEVNPVGLLYRLVFGTTESWHFDMEISNEKGII